VRVGKEFFAWGADVLVGGVVGEAVFDGAGVLLGLGVNVRVWVALGVAGVLVDVADSVFVGGAMVGK
jgi:hypothetical protein